MKRLAFLLAMSSGLLTARADADSLLLLHALSGDENAWFETLAASAPSAISDSVWQVFASPPSERPPWGQVGDEALWMLAHWTAASHADFIEQHRMVEQNGSQQFPVPDRPDRDWLLLFALLGGVAAIGATAWAWHTMRVRLLPLPEHLQPLEAVLQGHETERSRAISLWRAWNVNLRKDLPTVDLSALAPYRLTASELEVAAALIAGLSADEAALQLACTPAHVYNLRSRIRRKLSLEADVNLERHLQRLLNT